MPTLRERVGNLLLGDRLQEQQTQIDQLAEINQRISEAYMAGTYELPPEELVRQLREYYDPQLVTDLVDRMNWETISGYGGYSEDERLRAVADSQRAFKYAIIARWIVNLWTYYGLGVNLSIAAEDEAADEVWQDFWSADRNQKVLAKDRMDELSRWLLVTGERFHVFFASTLDGETTIRNVPPGQISAILTNPDDSAEPWFYERTWVQKSKQEVLYYPDWELFFNGNVTKAWRAAGQAYTLNGDLAQGNSTAAVMLFTPFVQLDEENLRGWPLLAPHGTPWLRAQREFMQNRLTVTNSKAAYVRRYAVAGGSRAVDSVRRTLASAFQYGGTSETNPPPVAGSSEVHNRAVDVTDLPMSTGAGDAKNDGEMFAWMAGLAGGVFPHYLGLGDAYRLATATAMEVPIQQQFSLYRNQLGAMLRKMVRIVLRYQEKYNGATYESYNVDVSTDRLVEADLTATSEAVGRVYRDMVVPLLQLGAGLPEDAQERLNVFLVQKVLEALGSQDVQDVISIEDYEMEPEAQEAWLAEWTSQPWYFTRGTGVDRSGGTSDSELTEDWVRAYEREKKRLLESAGADPNPLVLMQTLVGISEAAKTRPYSIQAMRESVERQVKAIEQHPGPTPRGQPLPPWEGQVEITADDVAEAIIRWNQEAKDEFRGLLEAEPEQPEGGEEEAGG